MWGAAGGIAALVFPVSRQLHGLRCRGREETFCNGRGRGTFRATVFFPQNHKLLAFFPLVFVIGTEGFAMFAPYVMLLLSLAYASRRLKPAPAPISIPI